MGLRRLVESLVLASYWSEQVGVYKWAFAQSMVTSPVDMIIDVKLGLQFKLARPTRLLFLGVYFFLSTKIFSSIVELEG